jgi:hypothetical protein
LTPIPDKDDKELTLITGKLISVESDDKDLYKPARGPPTPGTTRPIPPKEEAFISAGLEHIATLEHANHPEEPIMHQ